MFAALLIVGGCQPRYGSDWAKLTEANASVMFPSKNIDADRKGDTSTFTFFRQPEYFTFTYSLVTTPHADQAEQYLDLTRNGFVQGIGGKLVSERSLALKGGAGREIVVEDMRRKIILTARFYLAKSILYNLIVNRPADKTASDDAVKFLDSFELEQ